MNANIWKHPKQFSSFKFAYNLKCARWIATKLSKNGQWKIGASNQTESPPTLVYLKDYYSNQSSFEIHSTDLTYCIITFVDDIIVYNKGHSKAEIKLKMQSSLSRITKWSLILPNPQQCFAYQTTETLMREKSSNLYWICITLGINSYIPGYNLRQHTFTCDINMITKPNKSINTLKIVAGNKAKECQLLRLHESLICFILDYVLHMISKSYIAIQDWNDTKKCD